MRAEVREEIREHLRVAPILTRLRNGSASLETVNKQPSIARYYRFFWSESKQDYEYIRAPPPDPRAVAKSMLKSKSAAARRIPLLPQKPKAAPKPNLAPKKETRLRTPSSEAEPIYVKRRVKSRSQSSPTSSSHRPKGSVGLVVPGKSELPHPRAYGHVSKKPRSGKARVAEHVLAVPKAVVSNVVHRRPRVIPLSVLAKPLKPSRKKQTVIRGE